MRHHVLGTSLEWIVERGDIGEQQARTQQLIYSIIVFCRPTWGRVSAKATEF
jgi:hypothetical protein